MADESHSDADPHPQRHEPGAAASVYTSPVPSSLIPRTPVPDPRSPFAGLPFGSSYRTPSTRWWKGVLSILLVVAGILVLTTVGGLVGTVVDLVVGTQDLEALAEGQVSMTPALLTATNLSIVAAGVFSLVAHRFVSGVRVSYVTSVRPGFRWGWMWFSLAVAAPFYALFASINFLDPSFRLEFSATTLAFFAVIVLTTPLQAAAEEYLFRGVIQRAAGSWVASPRWALVIGTIVSATVFSVAHFAADPWLIAYYFLLGVGFSVLAQRTGGLESGIAIHTVNNLFLLGVSALADQVDAGFDRSEGAGSPFLLAPVVMLAVIVGVLSWAARRRRLALVTPPPATI